MIAPASLDRRRAPRRSLQLVGLPLLSACLLLWSSGAAVAESRTCLGQTVTLVGTSGDDTLRGTPRADVIVGLAGDDVIIGRRGDDRVCGRGGSDFLFGGSGDDRLATGPGNNSLSGDQGDDVLRGGSGTDDNANYLESPRPVVASIRGGFARGQGDDTLESGIDELFGSAHGDVLIGDKRSQLLAGFAGDDTIRGGDRNDLLAGGLGDDEIDGGRGAYDILDDRDFGGPGTEVGVRLDLGAGVETGHGRDKLSRVEGTNGSPGNDVLIGGPGRNVLLAGEGDDKVSGAGGEDLVDGGNGLDRLDGGPGTDYSASYESEHAVNVDLAAGTLTGPDPSEDNDHLVNIEDVVGSPFDDVITGDAGSNVLRGDPGSDVISGGAGDDSLHADCSKPKNGEPRHLFYEFGFDCSSPGDPDTLDGGADNDRCVDGESLTSCEKVRARGD